MRLFILQSLTYAHEIPLANQYILPMGLKIKNIKTLIVNSLISSLWIREYYTMYKKIFQWDFL